MNPDYAPLANGAIYQQMKDGDELSIGGWLTVNCVGPETVKNNGNQNMDSLNFVLIYGQKRMLFTGDYAASGNINRKYQDLVRNIDVLKFPHHGILDDKTNTYEIGVVLTRVLSPTYVLMRSVGVGNMELYCGVQRGTESDPRPCVQQPLRQRRPAD